MKRTITLLLLAVAVATPAQMQKKGQMQGSDATSKALIDMENKWVAALEKSDAAALDAILADSYVDADEQGHRSDKQAVLAILKSGDLKLESLKLSDMKVNVYGDAAVVTGTIKATLKVDGREQTSTDLFTEVFVKKGGKWQCVTVHVSPAVAKDGK